MSEFQYNERGEKEWPHVRVMVLWKFLAVVVGPVFGAWLVLFLAGWYKADDASVARVLVGYAVALLWGVISALKFKGWYTRPWRESDWSD